MIRYSENHHLNTDEEGTNVHIAIHLQGVSLAQAKGFVDVVLATAGKSIPTNDSSTHPLTATVAQAIKPATPGRVPGAPDIVEATIQVAPRASTTTTPCEKCGEAVSQAQAEFTRLFTNKTLCKSCMEAP